MTAFFFAAGLDFRGGFFWFFMKANYMHVQAERNKQNAGVELSSCETVCECVNPEEMVHIPLCHCAQNVPSARNRTRQ